MLAVFLSSLLFSCSSSGDAVAGNRLEEVSSDGTISQRRYLSTPILSDNTISVDHSLTVFVEPPSGASCPTALGVFVRASVADAIIYYVIYDKLYAYTDITSATTTYATYKKPYIQIDTPYLAPRTRHLQLVAVSGNKRSVAYNLTYYVEAGSRPYSYAFFVPGLESSAYFLKVGL